MTTPPSSQPIGPGRLVLVVGPSGAGKDTVIAGTKAACAGDPGIVFSRRVVTRPASETEDHDTLDDAAFDRAAKAGEFAFWWQAHGLKYGILRAADDDIRAGRIVVSNVSRAIIDDMRARYANVDTVLVTAPADVVAVRLARRGRQSDASMAERVERNDAFNGFRADHMIETTGAPEAAVKKLLGVIRGFVTAP